MAKIIIFGIKDLAELAHFYLTNDSNHQVVAFSVNDQYLPSEPHFKGLPIIPFEQIEKEFKPENFSFLAPLTHSKMNKNRETIYNLIKQKGFNCINYISSKATIFSNVTIGDNCFILEDNTIQPFVKIGNNTILWSGNHIGHHSTIGNHVFITSHVVISGNCTIHDFSFLGVNATLKENTVIGEGSFIAMAANITQNTEPYSVYNCKAAEKINMSSLKLRF